MPFLGEIRLFGSATAPTGWALCDGQLLSVASNTPLFNVLGNRFGGDGVSTFALPDLRGRVPLAPGQGTGLSNRALGEQGGAETVTLALAEMASHTHTLRAGTANGSSDAPAGNVPARMPSAVPQYGGTVNADLAATAIASAGGGAPHNNLQPYAVVTYIIAIQGTAP